ncbi:MAG: hypothetical protein RQ723_13230 [Desulfuromonadales bacterium]|nr:hypothetical protein [Desulfuromonadales bacterium]
MVLHRWNWYWLRDGVWYGGDVFGLLDQMQHYAHQIECVAQGRTVLNALMADTLMRAHADPDFPPKSATLPEERGP